MKWDLTHLSRYRYLLQCKADPSVRDAEQNVALHWAAYSGSVDIVAVLLDHGCEVNAANLHGDTPLLVPSEIILKIKYANSHHLKIQDIPPVVEITTSVSSFWLLEVVV